MESEEKKVLECDIKPDTITEKEIFKNRLLNTIQGKFNELMLTKENNDRAINHIDAAMMSTYVRNIYMRYLDFVPPQVETSCLLSEAVVAPDLLAKIDLIKAAIGIGGGAVGIAFVITAVGTALGWGAGVLASVKAIFVGGALGGPIALATAGLIIAGIAAYFAFSETQEQLTQRYLETLKKSSLSAVDAIWSECGEKLAVALK